MCTRNKSEFTSVSGCRTSQVYLSSIYYCSKINDNASKMKKWQEGNTCPFFSFKWTHTSFRLLRYEIGLNGRSLIFHRLYTPTPNQPYFKIVLFYYTVEKNNNASVEETTCYSWLSSHLCSFHLLEKSPGESKRIFSSFLPETSV